MGDVHMPDWLLRGQSVPAVVKAIERLVEEQPDRFTGVSRHGDDEFTVHVVDPAAATEEPFATLRRQADEADIVLRTAPSPRSRSELIRVMEAISHGAGAQWGIHPATATVRLQVAEADAEAAHAALDRFGAAITITSVLPATLAPVLPRGPREPRAWWPMPSLPVHEAIGMPADEVERNHVAEGFTVDLYHHGHRFGFHENRVPGRIRLFVRDGVVEDATQG